MQFKTIALGIVLIMGLFLGLASCETVETGERGVKMTWGDISSNEPIQPGLHFVSPVGQDIETLNVRTQKWKSKTRVYTSDSQRAMVTFTLNYNLKPDEAVEMYRLNGENWKQALIPHVVTRTISDVFGQANAVTDIIQNRDVVQNDITERIQTRLDKKGISVTGFEITGVRFTEAFDDANEAKQIAVERATAAKNDTVRIKEEADQKILTATAEAEAMKIKTQALAGNAKLVEYEAVQRWDGKLPQNMYGNAVPFIQTGR